MTTDLVEARLVVHRALYAQPAPHRILLEAFGSADAVLGASDAALAMSGVDRRTVRALHNRTRDRSWLGPVLDWLNEPQQMLLQRGEPDYPAGLEAVADAPPLLFCHGDPGVLGKESVAVVGSRAATPAGLEAAALFARELAVAGLGIVSGMALGIDAQAQSACLEAGGSTAAILGTGIDVVHPRRHARLAERIAREGVLVSEFPFGTPALPGNFPRRNRIISGLCRATLVVEAAEKSGTLITARLALEQGREVFAVPGSIFSRRSEGCHALIRDGAVLVRTPGDILDEMGLRPPPRGARTDAAPNLPDDQKRLLAILGDNPRSIDELAALTGLAPPVLAAALTELEIAGLIRAEGPGFRAVAP